jgi:hypothetical protein
LFRRQAKKPSPAKPKIIIAQVEGSGTALETVKLPELSDRIVSLITNVSVGSICGENEPKRADKDVDGKNSEVGGDELPRPLAGLVGKSCSVPTPDIVSNSEPNVVLLSGFMEEPPTG